MSNAVNDPGDNNSSDNRVMTDAEICQQQSSDEFVRIPQPQNDVPVGDLAGRSKMSLNRDSKTPELSPVRRDSDRQWLRDILSSIADKATTLPTATDAALSEICDNSKDPLLLDNLSPDMNVELDLLMGSLQLSAPQPPSLSPVIANSTDRIESQISTVEPVTHSQQLLQELNDARAQLIAAQTVLQLLNRRNQAQIDRVDANTQEVKQIKLHTQQLARYSKSQVEVVRELLDTFDRIRWEIVATLDRVGGYEQMQDLSVRLEAARQNALSATDTVAADPLGERVAAERAAFDTSLKSLRCEVAAEREISTAKLRQHQESVENLAQTIATDRSQTSEISAKLTKIDGLEDRLTTMYDRVVETSQTLQSKISHIERGFGELSQSVQSEKEQFYALTVETIEKADLLRAQLTQIANQIDDDRTMMSVLRSEVAQIDRSTPAQIDRQLESTLDVRDRQLLAICDDLQARHRQGVATIKKLSIWLWILSASVGTISILFVYIAVGFKRTALF